MATNAPTVITNRISKKGIAATSPNEGYLIISSHTENIHTKPPKAMAVGVLSVLGTSVKNITRTMVEITKGVHANTGWPSNITQTPTATSNLPSLTIIAAISVSCSSSDKQLSIAAIIRTRAPPHTACNPL